MRRRIFPSSTDLTPSPSLCFTTSRAGYESPPIDAHTVPDLSGARPNVGAQVRNAPDSGSFPLSTAG
jgi:hypothetical protein